MKQRREFASTLESCWRRENLTQAFLTKYFPISRAAKFSRGIIWIAAKIGGYSLPSLSLILFSPAICTFHKPFCFLSPTPPSLPAGKINWKKEREGEGEGKRKNTQRDSGWKRSTYVTLRVRTSTYICFPLFKDLFDIVTKVRRFDSFPLLSERISSLPIISSYTKRYASRRRKKREKEIECICEKKDILESFIFFQIHVSRWMHKLFRRMII